MAVLLPAPFVQFFDNNGDPLAGGKVYTYEAGTTTPKAAYTDSTGGTPLSNPVVLDASGRAAIWVDGSYKYVLKTSADVTIETVDNVSSFSASGSDIDDLLPSQSGNSGKSLVTDGVNSSWGYSSAPLSKLSGQILSGLSITNNGSDNINDIDVATGSCVSDDGTMVISISSALTKQIDSGWAVGTNQGGLDTGSVADGLYHVWAINRPDTDVSDILISTSSSSPTMPTNYTKKCRIGVLSRVATFILGYGNVPNANDQGIHLIMTKTANTSAQLDFTSVITSTYDEYIFEIQDIIPATDNTDFQFRTSTDNGANYDSGSGNYGRAGFSNHDGTATISNMAANTPTSIVIMPGLGNASGESGSGTVKFYNPLGSATYRGGSFSMSFRAASSNHTITQGVFSRTTNADIDAVRFFMSSGNIASGIIRLYGVKK